MEPPAADLERWRGYFKTKISYVGPHEILIRGYPLEDIIGNLSYAEVLYLTLKGELPSEAEAKMLEAILCCIVDHQMVSSNAPAVRFAASANPQLIPALAAGVLSVGENTVSPQYSAQLIEEAYALMAREKLTVEETARRIVQDYRRQRKRIPGLGHPTHKEYDPRAVRLRELARQYGFWGEKAQLYEAIHDEFVRATGRMLPINVDGASACIMHEMGFSPLEMAGIETMAFLPGLLAHAIEEIKEGVPLRYVGEGLCEYTGPARRELPPEKKRV